MKKNNRGFLLAESLVVSTFVLTILILLYIQFNNLTTNYKNSYNYNNVESIYDLSSVSNYLLTNNYNLSDQLTESKPYVIVYKDGSCNMDAGIIDSFCDNLISQMDAKTVIYTSSDISAIQKYVSENDDSNINQSLREFISRVETNTVQNKGRLFAEFNNGTFATIAMDNETAIEEPELSNVIQRWLSGSTSDFHSDKYKASIVTATFVDTREVPSNATESWDVSKAKDGGVMAWVIPISSDNTKYDLYIGADGGVIANSDSGYLFHDLDALTKITFGKNFDTSTTKYMSHMFNGCHSLTTIDLVNLDTSNNTNFSYMFSGCSSLTTLDLQTFDTSKARHMAHMFSGCIRLSNLNISSFKTSDVTNMDYMFSSCRSLTSLDLRHFDTSNVTLMTRMFNSCESLKTLNVSTWNTSKVTNMSYMFSGLKNLTNLNVTNFNTSNVTDMQGMFSQCENLNSIDVSNFNTSRVTNMYMMFAYNDGLTSLDLRNFDTNKVTNVKYMFLLSRNLKTIYVGSKWTTANADTTDMFSGCGTSSVTRV